MKEVKKENEEENPTCWFCGIASSPEVELQLCEYCKLVSYCGPRHQKLHRPKNYCYPIKVARHPSKGMRFDQNVFVFIQVILSTIFLLTLL